MTNKIIEKLKSPLLLNTAKMSFSNIIMYLLPFVVTPILSRIYGPAPFGEWGIFSSFVSIGTIAMFLGLENAIVKAQKEETETLVKLCILISVILISAIAIIFYAGRWMHIPFLCTFPNTGLLIIYLVFYSSHTILYNLCNKNEKFTILASSHIVLGLSQAVLRITFGMLAISFANGLIAGTTFAEGIAMTFLFVCIYKDLNKRKNEDHYDSGVVISKCEIMKRYRNFTIYDAPSSLLAFATFNLPLIILSWRFDNSIIGCFSIILQLLLLPMSFVGSAIGKVYYQQLCKNHDNIEHTKKISSDVIRIMSFLSILPLLFIACGGDKLIVIFLGASKWQGAGIVALCLSLWAFPTVLTQPLLPLFRYLDKQKSLFLFDSCYFVGGIGAILILLQYASLSNILISYSLACFIVKFLLFSKILKLSGCNLSSIKKSIPLWLVAISVLTYRLFTL